MSESMQHEIALVGGAAGERAIFTGEERDDDCRLTCAYRGKILEEVADDFFEALCRIRERLAAEGLAPHCYGASLNVYPSGMARSMGGALKAYRLTMGRQGRLADLVEIFATGPDVAVASVSAQAAFFNAWLASLGR